ncbi:50S ribosomal protein L2 [Candidatus Woesearchaeota archaeon]|nr:50S ribosomal protein L2 [Candidatus Woesearchaeota archaeon]
MGKPITAQKRGKGKATFTAPSFKFKGEAKVLAKESAVVVDIVHCAGHTAPLAQVFYEDGIAGYTIAAEGIAVGDEIKMQDAPLAHGNVLALKDIPEGVAIFNIEGRPNDGGKFVRGSGTTARVISKAKDGVTIQLPSRKQKKFHPDCRATIGVAAGGGRVEKPFLKAGKKFYAAKARNKYWPVVSASAMNAVAHPFGNKRTLRKSKAKPAPKNAPPGRLVGAIRPRKTGRARGKRI